MKKLICASLIVLATSIVCHADIFVVPLQVTGNYTTADQKTFSFDLGTALSQVHSVTFVYSGQMTAGLDYSGDPISSCFGAFLETDWIHAFTPWAGETTYPYPESFSGQSVFTNGEDWNFLLDGSASGWVGFPMSSGGLGSGPQVFPTGYLESASIVIDATPTPEPASALIFTLGAAFVRLRRK